MPKILFKIYLIGCISVLVFFIFFVTTQLSDDKDNRRILYQNRFPESIYVGDGNNNYTKFNIHYPILLWWTKFTGVKGELRSCKSTYSANTNEDEETYYKCYFTEDRDFTYHKNTKMFIFYGSDFMTSLDANPSPNLPLPRLMSHEWALLHEESPLNNPLLSQRDVITLFNHTATFSRYSSFPLTTQHLTSIADLEGHKYFKDGNFKNKILKERDLGLVAYINSHCNVPSGRDTFVRELMKYVKVDCLGACLHNKDLPKHLVDPSESMDSPDLYEVLSHYKFVLTLENAKCDDYITEKLWRALVIGSVPVYYGADTIRDWLPTNTSAILVSDFPSVEALSHFLLHLHSNDSFYNSYVQHKITGVTNTNLLHDMSKRRWGINNDYSKGNFVEHYECYLCQQIHRTLNRVDRGLNPVRNIADPRSYACPPPQPMLTPPSPLSDEDDLWMSLYLDGKVGGIVLKELAVQNVSFTHGEYERLKNEYRAKLRYV